MNIKEKALRIVQLLEREYPDAHCSLVNADAYQLLIATRLSAQCTDERVNLVTPALFERFPNVQELAAADIQEIEGYIRSCGLYKTKARNLKSMCCMLVENYGGKVPDTIENLIKLPGVGRKTANLIVGDIYGKPSIVVDTHCIRLTNRLGLVSSDDPYKIELALKKIIPPEKSGMFCHRLVWHGRAVCRARNPQCENCCLESVCTHAGEK